MAKYEVFMGIDPGKKGGIGVISHYNGIVSAYPYSPHKLKNILEMYESEFTIVYVEKAHSMPGESHLSSFSYGEGYGKILGLLEGFDTPYEEIMPQRWKKHFSLNKDKQKSIETCEHLFPNVNLLPTPQCRKKSDGMAEALLLAEYCRRRCESKE